MRQHIPPILFCRAPFSVATRIIRTAFHDGRQIFVQFLCLWRWSTPFAAGQDSHHLGFLCLNECQHVSRPDRAGRFADRRAIHADLTRADHPGGKAARFEKPRVPQPFIQPDCGSRIGQSLLNPANAAANGLSGSICFSRLGLAAKVCGLLPASFGLPRPLGLPTGLPLARGRSPCGRF